MADKNNNRSKEIKENFEKILPKLWSKARAFEESNKTNLNIRVCVICGCTDVPDADLDYRVKSNAKSIQSVKVRGARCSECGELYYDLKDLDAIKKFEQLLNELFSDT